MKFSIITPTFKRKELLERAVASLFAQTYKDWEMIIINDSPTDETYHAFEASINDPRIRYHKNEINMGVNASRNNALDKVSADSTWVIFLDDDDYLSPDALATMKNNIMMYGDVKWFVTNRAKKNGESLTMFPQNETFYSYAWSYLILKRCKGDATHFIETKFLAHLHARFSKYVKQGEEWFFFYQLGLNTKMFYIDHNSTISDGYDIASGLNFRKRTRIEKIESITKLVYEGMHYKLLKQFSFWTYVVARYIRACF